MTINYQFPYYPYTQFPGQPGYNQLGGTPYSNQYQSSFRPFENSYIENILRQMPFLSLMPMGNIKLSEVVTYIKTGAAAVGVGRDFYLGFTPKEITARTKEIIKEVIVKLFLQLNP